jgi:hypothetical protein
VATTYHIRIKKEYAAAVIEDLQKMDAVEFMSGEDAFDIPQWQKDEVRRRIENYKKNPDQYIDETSFLKC